MRIRMIGLGILLVLGPGLAAAQISSDVLGAHDMSPASGAVITGNLGSPCMYCHAPHSGINGTPGVSGTPLWSQKLSSVPSYKIYSSGTMVNKTNPSPPLGSNSTLCLSCHDGTVALGTLTPYGQVAMTGSLSGRPSDLGTDLTTTHPFSFVTPLQPSSNLWDSLSANPPSTHDATGAVQLINGNVECGSCHNPHVQNIDSSSDFLVIDNSQSALCLACHNPTIPPGSGMGLASVPSPPAAANVLMPRNTGGGGVAPSAAAMSRNTLADWISSIHATAPNRVTTQITLEGVSTRMAQTASLGPYTSVRKNGCLSCHETHNSSKALLRGSEDQNCLSCHNGSTNVSPPAPNISAEMSVPKISHSASATNINIAHSADESEVLDHNRHAACVDCHNPHSTKRVGLNFPSPPRIRASQEGVVGISATDGRSIVYPASNQYENCFRCHGISKGKTTPAAFGYLPERLVAAADPLNIIPQFALTSSSSHPVAHDRNSPLPQPSLRANMLELDGTRYGRAMGTRILCTDCHNSDDNREFGGTGANGPHGSKYPHLLERRYDMSQAPAPGQQITNLSVPPNLSATGNYALCAKCHDLRILVNNSSFKEHARHINDGFSCSVCHTGHGVGAQAAAVSGERMVDFDINVVAPNGKAPISYRRATSSCSLTCHGHPHSGAGMAVGTVRLR